MTFAEEIATYLAAQGLGTKGTDLFWDFYPETESTDTITVIRETGGIAGQVNDPENYQPGIQVVVRAATGATAKLQQAKIMNLLHGMENYDLTHHHVHVSEANGLPAQFNVDAQRRAETTANYSFAVYPLAESGKASTGFGGDKSPNLY